MYEKGEDVPFSISDYIVTTKAELTQFAMFFNYDFLGEYLCQRK